jgi:hypothetical protein
MANGFRLGPKAWEKAGRSPMGYLSSKATCALRPVHPELRTLAGALGGSLSGQNRPPASQHAALLFDHLVGASSDGGTVRPSAPAIGVALSKIARLRIRRRFQHSL